MASFEAQLVGQKMNQRLEALLQATQMGLADERSAEGQKIQREIAEIQANYARWRTS